MRRNFFKYGRALALLGLAWLASENAVAALTNVGASSDTSKAYYQISYTGTPNFFRIFLDTDRSATTGYPISGIGANYMIENNSLYRYTGSKGSWAWASVRSSGMVKSTGLVKWTLARGDIGAPAALKLVAQVKPPVYTSAVISQTLTSIVSPTPTPTPAPSPTPTASSTLKPLNMSGVTLESGFAYIISQDFGTPGDASSLLTQSKLLLYENGTPIGPAHAAHVDIRNLGRGRFSHWGNSLRFSTSDNTNPLTNGRSYAYSVGPVVAPSPTPTPDPVATPTPTPTPAQSSTGTFYVSPSGNDANPGSASMPWRTIQKAANTVVAGNTVILMDGIYEEPSVKMSRSGTALQPIVFKAQNKWMAILSSVSGCNPGFSITASYIKVKDIRFWVSPRNVTCGIYTSSNVHIRAWNTRVGTISSPSTGSEGFGADGIKVDFAGRSEGVKSNQDYTIIENSEFGHSIELFGSKDSVVRNNVVSGQNQHRYSIFAKGGVRNAQIYGNTVYNKVPGGYGIIVGGSSCGDCAFDPVEKAEAYNSVAYNNVVINQSSGSMAGLLFQGAKDSAFFNNVVINGLLAMQVGGQDPTYRFPTTNPIFKNNIVVCNGGPLKTLGFGFSYSGTMTMDYNNFTNCSGTIAQGHNVAGSVVFVNANSDWHLQPGSPGIDTGTPVTFMGYDGVMLDLSRDKNGVIRSAPWDLGIYNVIP